MHSHLVVHTEGQHGSIVMMMIIIITIIIIINNARRRCVVVLKTPRTSFAHPWSTSLHQEQKAACFSRADARFDVRFFWHVFTYCTDTDSALIDQIINLLHTIRCTAQRHSNSDQHQPGKQRWWSSSNGHPGVAGRIDGGTYVVCQCVPMPRALTLLGHVTENFHRIFSIV